MADELNPRQFTSLDYSNADLYSGLNQRPATATPLNIPLQRLTNDKPTGNQSATEQAYYRSEEIRRQTEYQQQRASQDAAQSALREREIARNQAANASKPAPPEQPTVSSRDYEKKFIPPTTNDSSQSTPSTGSTPPTIRQTAARGSSLVEPTATPAGVALAEAIPVAATGGILSQLPRALPQAAGRLAIPGVVGGIDFAQRVVHGQSVGHAAVSAIAGQVGFVGGFAIGSAIGGPLLGYALGAVGGMVTGAIADSFFHAPPSPAAIPEAPLNYPPFRGGQSPGVQYNAIDKGMSQSQIDFLTEQGQGNSLLTFTGPILSMTVIAVYPQSDPTPDGLYFNNYLTRIVTPTETRDVPFYRGFDRWVLRYPSALPQNDPVQPAPPPDNLPYRYDASPIGDDNTVPSGTPSAPGKRGKTRNVAPSMPSDNTPRGAPFFPGHGGLAPSYTPNPTQTPDNLGGMLPAIAPIPRQPPPFAEPDDVGIPVSASGNASRIENGVVTNPPTSNAQPIPLNSSRATVPSSSSPVPGRQNATPDSVSPTPKANTAPSPKTPQEAQADKTAQTIEQQKKDFDDQIGKLTFIATAIAALTPAIQGITPAINAIPDAIANSPTVKAANKETTKGAVCEIAQPGGCLGNALDDSANKVNQNNNQNTASLLDKINAGANAAQLALLELMNTKLGDLIPGGLSGKLQRLSSWMHLDRVLNILIWWQTLHNAYMLSANLGQTLTSAISNVLAAIGIKDAEGSPLEIGEILGHQFDSLAKSVIGESEWGGIKAEYKKWNRIYQAAANLMNSIQSIGYSILSALEVVGSWIASIGNALRKWGEVSDKAYSWMNPTPNFQNKFFTVLEKTEDVVSQIDSVASEVLSVEETVTQIGTQKTDFLKALGEDPNGKQGTPPPEAAKVKATADASKTVSATGLAISDSDKEADE